MANLIIEYRRRHKLNFVWAINDGVCYFTKSGALPLVCVTSDNTRPVGICQKCNTLNTTLVVEFYILRGMDFVRGIENVLHDHINPDTDLCKIVKLVEDGYKPYMARSQREIEVWLWNYFLRSKPLSNFRDWRRLLDRQKDSGETNFDKAVAQMLFVAQTKPQIYRYYYEVMYQPLLLGRKYMLLL